MPDYFTHNIGAELILSRLSGEQRKMAAGNRALYLLGAQGGDVFFFYGLSYKNNAGRRLHRANARELFEKLLLGDISYCAGWATHYALDCTVHPFVYAYENAHRGLFLHQRYERDLGLYVSRKSGMRRTLMPRESVIGCTPAVCDSIRKVLPHITPAGTDCCLKRYFAYTLRLFKNKKQRFDLCCDYSRAYEAFERGVELGVEAVRCVLEGNIDGEIFKNSFLQK